jgi:hypothetical protein
MRLLAVSTGLIFKKGSPLERNISPLDKVPNFTMEVVRWSTYFIIIPLS